MKTLASGVGCSVTTGYLITPLACHSLVEAITGCRVPYASGSLSGAHFVETVEDLAAVPIPADNGWLECLPEPDRRTGRDVPGGLLP